MADYQRETVLFTASGEVLAVAQRKLLGCESCSNDAEVPFKCLLDQVMVFSGVHYYWKGENSSRYFLAFVNAKGSCSMRRFEVDGGIFLHRDYRDETIREVSRIS